MESNLDLQDNCPEVSLSNSACAVRSADTMPQAFVPAIVLGGAQNALSVARNLARHGIKVFAVNDPYAAIRFSRFARYIHLDADSSPRAWEQFLLGHQSDHLRGSVLLACSDEAISILINNYPLLSRKFLLEETDPVI